MAEIAVRRIRKTNRHPEHTGAIPNIDKAAEPRGHKGLYKKLQIHYDELAHNFFVKWMLLNANGKQYSSFIIKQK